MIRRSLHSVWTVAIVGMVACSSSSDPRAAEATSEVSESPPPEVWFAPQQPVPIPIPRGSGDYFQLFDPNAAWSNASSHVDVFKMSASLGWIPEPELDQRLQAIIEYLNDHGIALALELGPLKPASCGSHMEGFAHDQGIALIQHIEGMGGHVRYVAMDEPFYYASIYSTPTAPADPTSAACHYTMEQVAQQVESFISEVHAIDPETRIGDIEPFFPAAGPNLGEPQYEAWLARLRGSLSFFHADVDWAAPGWSGTIGRIQTVTKQLGLRFGIIYNGDGGGGLLGKDLPDATWMTNVEARVVAYESGGANPDQVVFQSWQVPPHHVLPETDPSAFTNIIDRYARTRTLLSIDPIAGSPTEGVLSLEGKITDASGNPIAGAPIVVTETPTAGRGTPDTSMLSGQVPNGAVKAVIGLRMSGCQCDQSHDSVLAWFGGGYHEGAGPNLVTNGDLSAGASGWYFAGTAPPVLAASELGTGNEILVSSAPGESSLVNSPGFAVAPGVAFDATFSARIPPAAQASGYFAVFFLDAAGGEIARTILPLHPTTASATSSTDSRGLYSVSLTKLPGPLTIDVSYPGTDALWPARAVRAD
jgi:hypothetical protein